MEEEKPVKKKYKRWKIPVGLIKRRRTEYEYKMHQTHFWSSTIFHCPHCKQNFTHEEMWRAIAKDYPNMWEILDTFKCSWDYARKHIHKYNLEIGVKGTRGHDDWYLKAMKAGFDTPQEMFYYLKNRKYLSFKKIARLIGVKDYRVVRRACHVFLDPNFKLNKKRYRYSVRDVEKLYRQRQMDRLETMKGDPVRQQEFIYTGEDYHGEEGEKEETAD